LVGAETALAAGIVDRLARQAAVRVEASLYDGLASDVTALRLLAPGWERVAMDRLAELRTPAGRVHTSHNPDRHASVMPAQAPGCSPWPPGRSRRD
jgi:molybdopterin biosynthesis enzyme